MWDVPNGSRIARYGTIVTDSNQALPPFSPCGRWIYENGLVTPWERDGERGPRVLSAETGRTAWKLEGTEPDHRPPQLSFSPTGRWAALVAPDDIVDKPPLLVHRNQVVRWLEPVAWRETGRRRLPPAAGCELFPLSDDLFAVNASRGSFGTYSWLFALLPAGGDAGPEATLRHELDRPVLQGGVVKTWSGKAWTAADRALLPDAPGRRFHPRFRDGATAGRFVVFPRRVVDAVVDRNLSTWPVLEPPGPTRSDNPDKPADSDMRFAVSGGALIGGFDSEYGGLYWSVPLPPDVGADALEAWAEVMTRKRLDPGGSAVRLTEAEWETRRRELAALVRTADEKELFGRAAADCAHWLREAARAGARNIIRQPGDEEEAPLSVYDRLFELEPTPKNVRLRADEYRARGRPREALEFELAELRKHEAVRWQRWWFNNWPNRPADVPYPELLAPGRPRVEYELVVEWAAALEAAFPDRVHGTKGIALYRCGRFAEALADQNKSEGPEVVRYYGDHLFADFAAGAHPLARGAAGLALIPLPKFGEPERRPRLDYSFRAMCFHGLGRSDLARACFDAALAEWARQPGFDGFIGEATDLIRGPDSRRGVAPFPRTIEP